MFKKLIAVVSLVFAMALPASAIDAEVPLEYEHAYQMMVPAEAAELTPVHDVFIGVEYLMQDAYDKEDPGQTEGDAINEFALFGGGLCPKGEWFSLYCGCQPV